MKIHSGTFRLAPVCAAFLITFGLFNTADIQAQSMDGEEKAKVIADALSAAPTAVTKGAKVYAWNTSRQLVLVRAGDGPYACFASGNTSIRVGKPLSKFPDPMCLDQNALALFRAMWAEKNPMKPVHPYPTAPGMVWMLAGMGVGQGMIKIGTSGKANIAVGKSGSKITRLSPHLMIMPLPMAEKSSGLQSTYDPGNPNASWVMAAGSPIEHLMLHFSTEATKSMMNPHR